MYQLKKILGKSYKVYLFLIASILWSIFVYFINGEWLYLLPLILGDVIFWETIPWFFWKKKKKKEKIQKEDPKIIRLAHIALAIILIIIACSFIISFLGIIALITFVILYWLFELRNSKNSTSRYNEIKSWNNAILFAVIAATILRTFLIEAYTIPTSSMEKSMLIGDFLFVSKVAYGPRVPMTPLAIPLMHHTIPGTNKKSYSELIKLPYHRMKGTNKIKRNDCVVFNWPAEKLGRPIDKKENYVKRCVGMPGDKIELIEGKLFVNDKPQENIEGMKKQWHYDISTKNAGLNPNILYKKYDITEGGYGRNRNEYNLTLTNESRDALKKLPNIISIKKRIQEKNKYEEYIFPNSNQFKWNIDNHDPIIVPKSGEKINISLENIELYKDIIERYENNNLKILNDTIYINNKVATTYTFKMNYYWMLGDNRHNSADSRFWGFVPEDHIVGKALFVWMSWDKNGKGLEKIRWERLFTRVK